LKAGNKKVINRFLSEQPYNLSVCSIVKAELFYGACKSLNREKNIEKLSEFFQIFHSFPFDDEAAEIYGVIRADLSSKGTPIGPNDLVISSIALQNSLILVTHNTREFKRVSGLRLEDWEI
ncbi:MAG: type II toxin-antitoxin system VapC family toxin, partial [Desulfamplus sp.]|nr:type II toxin-antitoxin system VapC family toxin [Desulfamplus sp.]